MGSDSVTRIVAPVAHYMGHVIRWLGESVLNEEDLIGEPDLNRMLDPHRHVGPLRFRCGRDRCRTFIAYWAFASNGARIVFGPGLRDTRLKGVYPNESPDSWDTAPWRRVHETSVGAAADLEYPSLPATLRFEPHIEWAMQAGSPVRLTANPDVPSAYPLRFTFICPKCHAEHAYTNSEMIRLFVDALDTKATEVRPG